jgi:hypothetical protein
MPQLSPQHQANSPQDDVSESGIEEMPPHGTRAMQQPLLSSSETGMIVFSSSARILHMNGPARALMALFGKSYELWPQMAPESMPSILTEFCYDVLAELQRRIETQDWAQFEIRRICHMVTPSLMLTGFGVPNSTNRELRVILTINPQSSSRCAAANSRHLHPPTNVQALVGRAIS